MIYLNELRQKSLEEISELMKEREIEIPPRRRKEELILMILQVASRKREEIMVEGYLEISPEGNHGFLRSAAHSFLPRVDDIYVSHSQIRRFALNTGDKVCGNIRPPKESERYFALAKLQSINDESPEKAFQKVNFDDLTPIHVNKQFQISTGSGSKEDLTARVIDLISPIGPGQRGLIVAPPKVGKTMMLQNIARSLTHNYPDVVLIVLLIGERPEEVTEMERSFKGDVVASTFDEPATRQVQLAEMTLERAKRLVEQKKDVVILMDSMTRLARAYNTVVPNSGKVLTGGIDANALQKPKRFFGAARNVEEGGSLTILATALIDTGSKMDEVIYEEFKGTGNMELHLDRKMAEKRNYPAVKINSSGTRREELIMPADSLSKVWVLRKVLHSMEDLAANEFLLERLRLTKTNEEFFEAMKRQ